MRYPEDWRGLHLLRIDPKRSQRETAELAKAIANRKRWAVEHARRCAERTATANAKRKETA